MKVSTLWKHLIHLYECICGMWVSLFVLPGINPRASVIDKQTLSCIPSPLSFTSDILLNAIHFLGKAFVWAFVLFSCAIKVQLFKNIYIFSQELCGFSYVKGKSMFLGGNIWFTFSCEDLIFNRNVLACHKLKPPVAESSFLFSSSNSLFKQIIRIVSQYAFKHWKYNQKRKSS